MSDGQILLCDNSNKIGKVLHTADKVLTLTESLELQDVPWDIELMTSNSSDAVITIPKLKLIRILEAEPSLKTGIVIQCDK